MKILLLVVGKTSEKWLQEGINEYATRINNYAKFDIQIITDLKHRGKIDTESLKKQEGNKILMAIDEKDLIILLDENGKNYRSTEFASIIEKNYAITSKRVVFVIGGAFGFCDSIYKRANNIISLSKMTFSHQIVRLLFVEQLYRAFTIIKNEPYHHE